MPPAKINWGPPQIWDAKHQLFDHFFATSARDTAYLQNGTSHRQTKMLLSIYNVSPKSWPTFLTLTQKRLRSACLLWPTIRRPLLCNHHSCDMSSFFVFGAVRYWPSRQLLSARKYTVSYRIVSWPALPSNLWRSLNLLFRMLSIGLL